MKHAVLVLLLLIFGCPAMAAGSKNVRDWRGTCDNDGRCVAEVTGNGGLAMGGQGYRLEIARAAGVDEGWTLLLAAKNVPQPVAGELISISIANSEVMAISAEAQDDGISFGFAAEEALPRVFAGLKKGQHVTIVFGASEGPQSVGFSLSGLAAILLWIDEQQGRVGNSDQVMAVPGAKPGTMLAGVDAEAFKADILKLSPASSCQWLGENADPSVYQVESFILGAGKTLYVVGCIRGAYQGSAILFARDEYELRALSFPEFSDEFGWGATLEIGFEDFNPASKTLMTFVKFRGIGDCGSTALYRWKDYGFKLLEYRYQGKCEGDGSGEMPEYPVIYKAKEEE